jgi:SnoaL-like polyketide cyclase
MQMTIHGTHRESAIPLLTAISPTGKRIRWEFIHLFRVSGGQVAEHFAARDDPGLLRQLHGAGRAKGVPGFARTDSEPDGGFVMPGQHRTRRAPNR